MNIGLLTEMMNVGGAAALVLRQARWLKAHGHGVIVLSAGGALLDDLPRSDIPHIAMTSFEPGKQFTPEQLVREGALLQRAISDYRLDAIIAQAQWPFPFAVVAAAGAIPVFLDLLSPVYWIPKTAEGIAAVRSAAADGRVIATAVVAAQSFAAAYGFDVHSAHITNVPIEPPGQPIHSREEIRRLLDIGKDEIVVITVARLDADRAPMILPLARAVDALSNADRPVRCIVVGDGTHAAALRSEAPASTIFTGFRRDLADLYNAADLFVGEGSVVQDAAATGLPALITCATVYPQQADQVFSIFGMHIVDHFFVSPSSVIAPIPIADALRLVLDDPDNRTAIARAGKESFEAYWAIDQVMIQRLAILSNRHERRVSVGSCEAILEIDGGMADDVEIVAQALAEIERPERFGVVANHPVPWARFFTMRLDHVRALSRAAFRAMYPPNLRYRLDGRTVEGPIAEGHRDLTRYIADMPAPPQDKREAFDFGAPSASTTLLVVSLSGIEKALAYISKLPQSEAVVAWQPEVEEGDRRFPDAWDEHAAQYDDRRYIVGLQGALPWALFSRVARGAARYVDDGSDRWRERRDLAEQLGLRIERL